MKTAHAVVTLALAALVGCSHKEAAPLPPQLQWIPADAWGVLTVDGDELRRTPLHKYLNAVKDRTRERRNAYDDFVARCGFDPLTDLRAVTVVWFSADAQAAGDYVMLVRATPGAFQPDKLLACSRRSLEVATIPTERRGGDVVYLDPRHDGNAGAFLGADLLVVGTRARVEAVVDLAHGRGAPAAAAKSNARLDELAARVAGGHAVWAAAAFPDSFRAEWAKQANFKELATVQDAYGFIDLAKGLWADLQIDVSSEADAKTMATHLNERVRQTSSHPVISTLGFGRFVNPVHGEAKGKAIDVDVRYSQAEVADMLDRLERFVDALAPAPNAPTK